MTDTKDANEQMAVLLGWTYRDEKWWHPSGGSKGWPEYVPDFTVWDRFPEMQEYVRGLSLQQRNPVIYELNEAMSTAGHNPMLYITPTILRNAILAVSDD